MSVVLFSAFLGPQARVTRQGDARGALPRPQGEEILPCHACIHALR